MASKPRFKQKYHIVIWKCAFVTLLACTHAIESTPVRWPQLENTKQTWTSAQSSKAQKKTQMIYSWDQRAMNRCGKVRPLANLTRKSLKLNLTKLAWNAHSFRISCWRKHVNFIAPLHSTWRPSCGNSMIRWKRGAKTIRDQRISEVARMLYMINALLDHYTVDTYHGLSVWTHCLRTVNVRVQSNLKNTSKRTQEHTI